MNATTATATATVKPRWQIEFPDYPADAMPALPAYAADFSWHNDNCPSFRIVGDDWGRVLRLWIDYPDAAQRDMDTGGRFLLQWDDYDGGDARAPYCGDDFKAALHAATVERVAWTFADMLANELRPDDWTALRIDNRAADAGTCASHDYCDANMTMAAAIEAVTGAPALSGEGETLEMPDATQALWNQAWNVAKAHFLTSTTDDRTTRSVAFDQWRETGKPVDDLRKHEERVGTIEDEEAGRIYDCGFIVLDGHGNFYVTCGNAETVTRSLIEAERFLWTHHAEGETRHAAPAAPASPFVMVYPRPNRFRVALEAARAALMRDGAHAAAAAVQSILDQAGTEGFEPNAPALTDLISIIIDG